MFSKIKKIIIQHKCKHNMLVNKWHWVHFHDYEPANIEIEYKCTKCGKVNYLHLYDDKAKKWARIMGDCRKVV